MSKKTMSEKLDEIRKALAINRANRNNARRNRLIVTMRNRDIFVFDKIQSWKIESEAGKVTSLNVSQDTSCISRFGFVDLNEILGLQEVAGE